MKLPFLIFYVIINLLMTVIVVSFSGVKSGASNFVSSIADRAVGSSRGLAFSYFAVSILGTLSFLCALYIMHDSNQHRLEQEALEAISQSGTFENQQDDLVEQENSGMVVAMTEGVDIADGAHDVYDIFAPFASKRIMSKIMYRLGKKR